jgi:hypothetical protein
MANEWDRVTKEFEMTNEALLKLKSSMESISVSMIALKENYDSLDFNCGESHE